MTPSQRDLERRVDRLAETDPDSPRELGWFDLLEYVARSDPGETSEEYFGEPVMVTDAEWSRRLRRAGGELASP